MRKLLVLEIVALLMILVVSSCDSAEDAIPISGFVINEVSFQEGNDNAGQSLIAEVKGNSVTEVGYQFLEGTAKFGDDLMESSGSVAIENGSIEIQIPIVGDTHLELEESFQLVLTADGNEFTFDFTIEDDDFADEISEDENGFFTPEVYPSMNLTWSEEFEGDLLDGNTWTYEIGNGCEKELCGWGNNELQEYTDLEKNIKVANGFLTIVADEYLGGYNSARIITQDKVELTHGRIDIRAKMPKGQGIWPAMWLLGANIDDEGWPMCGEIDIMEIVGHTPEVTHGTVHYDDGEGYTTTSGSRSVTSGDLSDKFHVYSILWDRNEITWYLDNVQFKTFTKTGSGVYPFNDDFFFILNIAVGGNWPGNPDETTVFPQDMVVDYIRVFN